MKATARIAQVGWLNGQLCLDYIRITRSLLDGDLVSSLLLPAISDANVGHLDNHPELTGRHLSLDLAYPDALRRPARVMGIAASLGIPRETARCKLARLVEAGIVHQEQDGFVLRSETLTSERFLPSLPRYLSSLDAFVEGLALIRACGLEAESRLARPVWPVAWAALRLSTAHVLRDTAYVRELAPERSLLCAYVLLAVAQLTGAHLTLVDDMPEGGGALGPLAPRFGPVSGAEVARMLDYPLETVRRQLVGLVRSGRLSRTADGYEVVRDADARAQWRLFQQRTETSTRQFVWRLSMAGVIPPVGPH